MVLALISRKGPYRCPAQYNNNQLAKKLERERESDGLTFQQGPIYINKKNTIQCDIFHTITNLSYISAGCPKRKLDFAFFFPFWKCVWSTSGVHTHLNTAEIITWDSDNEMGSFREYCHSIVDRGPTIMKLSSAENHSIL